MLVTVPVPDISHRARQFAKKFCYEHTVAQLYSYEMLRKEKLEELKSLDEKIYNVKSELPSEIVKMYEQQRIVEQLGE